MKDASNSLTSMPFKTWGHLPKAVTLLHRIALRQVTTSGTTTVDQTSCINLLNPNTPPLPSPRAARMIMADQEQPWYAKYPPASSTPNGISRGALLNLLKQSREDERFVLVDLRKTDHEVCQSYSSKCPYSTYSSWLAL